MWLRSSGGSFRSLDGEFVVVVAIVECDVLLLIMDGWKSSKKEYKGLLISDFEVSQDTLGEDVTSSRPMPLCFLCAFELVNCMRKGRGIFTRFESCTSHHPSTATTDQPTYCLLGPLIERFRKYFPEIQLLIWKLC